jgi:UDP-glucose 4-epimerase
MKKILVTGGLGYIGSHCVVKLIENNYEPVIIDNLSNSKEFILQRIEKITNKKIKYYKEDCCDEEILRKIFDENEISGVIHFAAFKAVGESVENPLKYYKNNLGSLISLLKIMGEFKVDNLVFSSSCTVYGAPDKIPVNEEAEIKEANCPYGETKIICEKIINDVVKADKLKNVALLRYFNPIGAHESGLIGELPIGTPSNLVPFITQTAIGKREELTIFGDDYATVDGTCIRDYIHVMDLVNAHIKALDVNGIEIFNLGMGKGVSVKEIVDKFEEVSKVKLKYKFGERRAGDVPAIYADASKANEKLNWKCEYSVKDALIHAWNWEKKLNE